MIRIDTNLLDLLPDFYAPIKDYQEIMTAEEFELAQLASFINAVHDNFFIQTMGESMTEQWEKLLGIAVTNEEDLAFRRMVVLNRITMKPPFTLGYLYRKLDELIGAGKWEVVVDYENYTLYVESAAESQGYAVEVAYTIERIKPAHIVYINRPFLSDGLLLNEVIGGQSITWYYRLGSWALGRRPFRDLADERTYKMANQQSLTNALITGVSNFVSGDIAKARINNSVIITEITKSRTDNVLTVSYDVPEGVPTITMIELLDANNTPLTSSNVYIPVASGVEIKHRITTKEGE